MSVQLRYSSCAHDIPLHSLPVKETPPRRQGHRRARNRTESPGVLPSGFPDSFHCRSDSLVGAVLQSDQVEFGSDGQGVERPITLARISAAGFDRAKLPFLKYLFDIL